MKLTDVKIVCLEEILEFLDIKDLLNAADANKRLRRAATSVFEREYGKMPWIMEQLPKHPDPLREISLSWDYRDLFYIDESTDTYFIEKRKLAFQLVRCFGSLLPSINCFYQYPGVDRDEGISDVEYQFINYIYEFCSETIETLKLDIGDWNRTLMNFTTPFKQVKQLCITNLKRERCPNTDPTEINCLNRLFPQMRSLLIAFDCSPFIHAGCIAQYFPNIEELSIYVHVPFPVKRCDECLENYREVVRLNPQLKRFEFTTLTAFTELIVHCAEHLQNIERLDLNFSTGYDPNFTIDAILHFKNVKHLKAKTRSRGFHWNYMDVVDKLTFDHLETFTLQVCRDEFSPVVPHYENQLKNFCERNQSIKQLTLIILPYAVEFVLQFKSWLHQTLPLLEELEFHLYNFGINTGHGINTAKLVHKTITNILRDFDTVPSISINLACPLHIYQKKNRFCYCDVNDNFLNGFRDFWSVSWSDPKHYRLIFKRRIDAD